jgi:hypothetical protein
MGEYSGIRAVLASTDNPPTRIAASDEPFVCGPPGEPP